MDLNDQLDYQELSDPSANGMDNTDLDDALGDPDVIAPTFADLLDAIHQFDGSTRAEIFDAIMDELSPANVVLLEEITGLTQLLEVTIAKTPFTQWLRLPESQRITAVADFWKLIDLDPCFPETGTRAEYRDYVVTHWSYALEQFDRCWAYYRHGVLNPNGEAATVAVDTEYKAVVRWPDGHDEVISPEDETSRYNAECRMIRYNMGRNTTDRDESRAVVAQRRMVKGPLVQI